VSLQRSRPRRFSGPSWQVSLQRSRPSQRPGVITTISSQTTCWPKRAPRCHYNDLVPDKLAANCNVVTICDHVSVAIGTQSLQVRGPFAMGPTEMFYRNLFKQRLSIDAWVRLHIPRTEFLSTLGCCTNLHLPRPEFLSTPGCSRGTSCDTPPQDGVPHEVDRVSHEVVRGPSCDIALQNTILHEGAAEAPLEQNSTNPTNSTNP